MNNDAVSLPSSICTYWLETPTTESSNFISNWHHLQDNLKVSFFLKRCQEIVGQRGKIKRKNWLKHPKAVPQKTKFGPKYNWFKISHLEFFYWKYYSWHTTFLYPSACSSGHHQSFFLIPDFLEEILKAKRIYR